MPVKSITTEFGHSLPPEAPHNITFHIPGWQTASAFRKGDAATFARLSSIYPRFSPWCEVKQLADKILGELFAGEFPEGYGVILFVHPDCFETARVYSAAAQFRKPEHVLERNELKFRVVDATGVEGEGDADGKVRLYVIGFPLSKGPGVMGTWQTYGTGVSSRLAEACLKGRLEVVKWEGDGGKLENVPEPTYLQEGEGHRGLKDKIVELLKRGARDEGLAGKVGSEDVRLYPTGMAAIWRLHKALVGMGRKGKIVILGSVFPSTWGLTKESEGGMKHFGRVTTESGLFEELEEWLEGEKREGRGVAYLLTEFPSNPILESVDLGRLKALANKYSFPVVVDDTIGSFANIDILPEVDAIVTSTTKSLSGYANVMGGSIVLAPHSPFYTDLKSTIASQFRNEWFAADAAKLFANSQDYLSRSGILNRNALTLSNFLESQASLPSSPVKAVLYPPFLQTHDNYKAVMRKPTKEFPTPGYGCLLAVDFESMETAKAFYDNLSVYHGPHLGAHLTLAMPFNDIIWGAEPGAAEYLKTYGANPEQVRISVGLESEEELLDTLKFALAKAEEEKRKAE